MPFGAKEGNEGDDNHSQTDQTHADNRSPVGTWMSFRRDVWSASRSPEMTAPMRQD